MTEPLGWTPAAIAGADLRAAERAWRATGWTGQHLRHEAAMIRQGGGGGGPVAGDAAGRPLAAGVADGLISVEAAFHFRSRRAFFAECYRVLRPGGVLSITDISTERLPRSPAELASGLAQLRVFGLRPGAAMTAGQIAAAARA